MSREIVVRLPDAIVEFIDSEIGAGHAHSRAAFILRALEREHRRRVTVRAEEQVVVEADDDVAYVGYRSLLWTNTVEPRT